MMTWMLFLRLAWLCIGLFLVVDLLEHLGNGRITGLTAKHDPHSCRSPAIGRIAEM
jgi:hypothetical protein